MINGKPILAPDAGVEFSYEDLDDADSGRDESGVMHRIVTRYKVGKWTFSYAQLSEEEMQYMESLFPDAPTFLFFHPGRGNAESYVENSMCYRSKYSLAWRNAKTGMWNNYKFSIIEC